MRPSLEQNIAMAYVAVDHAEPGRELAVVIRGKPVGARVRQLPFYRRAERPAGA